MVTLANLTEGVTTELVTKNGTLYEVINRSTSGYNYLSIPLLGEREFEIVQAGATLAGEYYDHMGVLFLNWIESDGSDHENYLDSQDFGAGNPYALRRTIRATGPTRLVFKTYLDAATKLTFTALIREIPTSEGFRW